jgi:hypothetical protein
MYDDVLKRLGIDGETDSDRFRSLIEFMYDYVEVSPPPTVQVERKSEPDTGDRSRIDVLDLIIQSLKDHEAGLDRVASRLEKMVIPGIQSDE